MMRDGVSQEYYEYEISTTQEEEWLMEILNNELKKLNINEVSSLSSVQLILRFKPQTINQYLQKIVDFILNNEMKANNGLNILLFSQKIVEIIDYYITNNSKEVDNDLLKNEKKKLVNLREKYL